MTDLLVVRYLAQLTGDEPCTVEWHDAESNAHETSLNGVQIEFQDVPELGGSRLFLTLNFGGEQVHIAEPRVVSLFGKRYASEEERDLAAALKTLGRLIARQRSARRETRRRQRGASRQTIFHRLLFGSPSQPGDC